MRTTVTLEVDLAAKLQALARRRRISFKKALNDVFRRGLAAQVEATEPAPFFVEPHAGGFRPGIHPDKLNQLLDQFAVDEFVVSAGGWRTPPASG